MESKNTRDNGSKKNPADGATTGKKPFDKKKYRLKKYSNKYKLEQWDDRRKKAVLRGFYKDLRKAEQRDGSVAPILKPARDKPQENSFPEKKRKSPFFAAKEEFKKKKAEKLAKKQRSRESREERQEALKNYKEKKMEMFKRLSKKTKKGQPVMKDRLEMLLEKIKESTGVK